MKPVELLLAAGMLFTAPPLLHAQEPSMPANMDQMDHSMHLGHHGHHAVAQGVALDQKTDPARHTVLLREGPFTLPANTDHMKMAQPPDVYWVVLMDGWLLSYTPSLVDRAGNEVPGRVLHHTAFWNENRADFLCPNKEEHIFGAGSELTNWAAIPGFGYWVKRGDRIRIETMVYNPTDTSYKDVYLVVKAAYADASAANIKSVYPAWMDVQSCGDSGYDLPPGKTEKSGKIKLQYSGALLGVGGHLHDFGRQLTLQNTTRKETVAVLTAASDAQGRLLSIPVKTFFDTGGYALKAGEELETAATYDNPTGKTLTDGAMGIVVGYFAPADDAAMAALRHKTKGMSMPGMSHDK